jgi:triacylglycerol lipase
VNHLDLVGWINLARYKLAEWTGKEIKFKPATFYLGITHTIAEQVEELTWEDEEERKKKVQAATGSTSFPSEGNGGIVGPAPGVE